MILKKGLLRELEKNFKRNSKKSNIFCGAGSVFGGGGGGR